MPNKFENIENRITTSFSVSCIPVGDFKRFKELADKEFRGNYAMALKFLMDSWEKHSFYLSQFNALWQEIANLKDKEIKSKPKTFESVED